MLSATEVQMRKYKYCAYNPNDGTFANFSDSRAKVLDGIELMNRFLSQRGKPTASVVECKNFMEEMS